jgi:hypothetical protein
MEDVIQIKGKLTEIKNTIDKIKQELKNKIIQPNITPIIEMVTSLLENIKLNTNLDDLLEETKETKQNIEIELDELKNESKMEQENIQNQLKENENEIQNLVNNIVVESNETNDDQKIILKKLEETKDEKAKLENQLSELKTITIQKEEELNNEKDKIETDLKNKVFETIDNSQKEPENKNEIQKFTINNNSVKFNVFENAAILHQLNHRLQQLTNSNIELLGNERNVTENVIRRLIVIINIKAQMAEKTKMPVRLNESIHFPPPPPPTSQPGQPSNIMPPFRRTQIETNTVQSLLPPSIEQQSKIGTDKRTDIGEDQTPIVNNKIRDLFEYINSNKVYLTDTLRNFIEKFNFSGNNDNGTMFTNLITSISIDVNSMISDINENLKQKIPSFSLTGLMAKLKNKYKDVKDVKDYYFNGVSQPSMFSKMKNPLKWKNPLTWINNLFNPKKEEEYVTEDVEYDEDINESDVVSDGTVGSLEEDDDLEHIDDTEEYDINYTEDEEEVGSNDYAGHDDNSDDNDTQLQGIDGENVCNNDSNDGIPMIEVSGKILYYNKETNKYCIKYKNYVSNKNSPIHEGDEEYEDNVKDDYTNNYYDEVGDEEDYDMIDEDDNIDKPPMPPKSNNEILLDTVTDLLKQINNIPKSNNEILLDTVTDLLKNVNNKPKSNNETLLDTVSDLLENVNKTPKIK